MARHDNLPSFLRDIVGYDDESPDLTRSIGELQNSVFLSAMDPAEFDEWKQADAATRRAKYGPVHIRLPLEKAMAGLPLIVDKDWYGDGGAPRDAAEVGWPPVDADSVGGAAWRRRDRARLMITWLRRANEGVCPTNGRHTARRGEDLSC